MKSIADLLEDHPFFSGLGVDALELIAGCGVNVHFEQDQMMLREHEPADSFYVVRSGRVAIEINTAAGGPVVIDTVGPGEILGVSWLLPPYQTTFDARTVEATSAVALDAACLRGKCDADPMLGYELFKRFAGLIRDRLQSARLRLTDIYAIPGGSPHAS